MSHELFKGDLIEIGSYPDQIIIADNSDSSLDRQCQSNTKWQGAIVKVFSDGKSSFQSIS